MDEVFSEDLLYAEGPACMPRIDPLVPSPPAPPEPGLERLEAPVSQPVLWLGWTLPGAWRDDTENELAAGFLSLALAMGLERAHHHRDDRFALGCELLAGVEASTVVCGLELPHGVDAEKAARKALSGVEELWEDDFQHWRDEFLLPMVAHGYRSGLVRSIEERSLPGSTAAQNTALFYHYTGDPRWLRERIRGLDGVDPERVGDVAREWLSEERAAMVLLEPSPRPVAISSASDSYQLQAEPPVDPVEVTEITRSLSLDGAVEHHLDNGLDVVILPYGDAPLVRAALVLGGGARPRQGRGSSRWWTARATTELRAFQRVCTLAPWPSAGTCPGGTPPPGAPTSSAPPLATSTRP